MKDPIALIDAILDTYDRLDFQPSTNGTTFCNMAVGEIARTYANYNEFMGKSANEIVAFLTGNSEWSSVAFDKAQDMVNEGSLLVAGLASSDLKQAHGHVVVLRPGKPCYSGKWPGPCPRVVNVGAENFIARAKRGPLTNQPCGLNESFQELPKIWVLRSTL